MSDGAGGGSSGLSRLQGMRGFEAIRNGTGNPMKHVVIVGGGFAGLNAAKKLGGRTDVRVTLVDRQNYHLFQPLLYQVAMAGLSPADIATPIRSVLARCGNISVLQGSVEGVDLQERTVSADFGRIEFDYLLLCCGSLPSYFGHGEWEEHAPSLKTIPQATEIRRRLLSAFEEAERTEDPERRRQLLTFVVIGGGPTGVELAGAIGEMSRFTLARDFRNIDTKLTRVILIESGPRILSMFSEKQASRAARDLEKLGVQVLAEHARDGYRRARRAGGTGTNRVLDGTLGGRRSGR